MTQPPKPPKPVITICSSCSFYRQASDVAEQLETLGVSVVLPETVDVMKKRNDWDVSHYKTWFANEGDYDQKGKLMRAHFEEIHKGDAILVLNYEKHGQQNYIGPNVLMEMALAFDLKLPIFILNEIPENSPFEEELKGMLPIVLHGKLQDLPTLYNIKH